MNSNGPIGFRIGERNTTVSDDVIAGFAQLETPFVGDAMSKFNAMDAAVRPVVDGMHVVGRAFTVRPALGDNLAVYLAIEQVGPQDVLVIESRGLSSVAQWGDLTSAAALQAGAAGAVMDGSIRDRSGIRRVGLPVFALPEPVAAGGTRNGPGELNVPVSVGGVAVCPGDIIIGDDSGVVTVPSRSASEVLASAEKLAAADAEKMVVAETSGGVFAWMDEAKRRAGYGS